MANLNQAAENPVYLDWRVWADINYLDSPTEYREYLPTASNQKLATRADFVLLSTSKLLSRRRTWILRVIKFLVVVLIAGYCLCVFMHLP